MKILILGCGSIGKRHAQNAVDLGADVGVCDLKVDAVNALATSSKITPFTTVEEGLSWEPNGVVIATPHKTHIDLATKAINAGTDVLIEKPISNEIDDVKILLDVAKKNKRQINVVCNMRYHEAVMAIRSHLHEIGNILFAKAHYGNHLPNMRPNLDYRELYCARKDQGGGVILDVIHEIDYLIWLLGEVKAVSCTAQKISNLDIDVEDYANMNFTHTSGCMTNIQVDYLRPFKRRGCEIVGNNGMIIWQSEGKAPEKCSVKIYKNSSQKWFDIIQEKTVNINASYIRLMQAFIMKIYNPDMDSDLSDGRQGLAALKTALRAHKSSMMGGSAIE